jgi:hypothetical protein
MSPDTEHQECGHKPYEAVFRWKGSGPWVEQRLCGACAPLVWDRMPQPIRETFSCREITA